ncbi:MAG: hypothetical protein D6E12_13590 [Desulfovibrio sp.]|nr:MAG: hypothetical protein D6E12_13590 [Desulfovibrio sp.]
MKSLVHLIFLFLLISLLAGCVSAQSHREEVRDDTGDRVTVGTVQREIRVGMSGAEVIEALGSPNVVSTDEHRREVWVYDKFATERVTSGGSAGVWLLVVGGGQHASASSTSQRTLTIIVKFDEQGLVRDFAYRQSSF